jgi:hypothetical protein
MFWGVTSILKSIYSEYVFLLSVLEGMWKEMIMFCFQALSQHLPGGTEENL